MILSCLCPFGNIKGLVVSFICVWMFNVSDFDLKDRNSSLVIVFILLPVPCLYALIIPVIVILILSV